MASTLDFPGPEDRAGRGLEKERSFTPQDEFHTGGAAEGKVVYNNFFPVTPTAFGVRGGGVRADGRGGGGGPCAARLALRPPELLQFDHAVRRLLPGT
ncbi:hypothetical protein EVAR_99709_1 [Eumeta japonica]|uniref:Uncharacterized protein n=1 Tax=Eumeta variegata TaxID=151549 RepID=A0A4C1ZTH4_EUMVA|nr:hypothetical protein EVAR_99709_1 [Eumeta japonica]